jgi:hypothetical protein
MQTLSATSERELAEGNGALTFLTGEIKNYPKNIATESKVAQNQQFIKPKILELELQRSELLSEVRADERQGARHRRQIAEPDAL